MQTNTKYFGLIEYEQEDVLRFDLGLFGFEDEKQFILLPFGEEHGALLCLQSLTTPLLAFMVMNPFFIYPEYAPTLQQDELEKMQVQTSHDLCYYVMCVVRNPVDQSTVNLKCPIVIDEKSSRAMQVILDTQQYQMRQPLAKLPKEEGEATC